MKQYDVKISRMALSDMEQIYSYIVLTDTATTGCI